MSEWKQCEIGELVQLSQGLAINKQSKHLLKDNGLPLLRITDMFSDKYEQFIDGENAPTQCIAKPSDIIYTRTGQVGFVFRNKTGVIHNNCFKVTPKEGLDSDFLFWFLKQTSIQELANNIASGSVQLDLPHGSFKSIEIKYPESQSHQKLIASFFSSLEAKIDLLHRQNATLEKMAETLFRQWFVEEAKEGNVKLGDFVSNIRENAKLEDLKSFENYVGLEHIPRKQISLTTWGKPDLLVSNKSIFKENDILFGKLRSYFHKVVFAPVNGICSTDILVIRPKKEEWFAFSLFWFFTKEVVEYSDLGSGGTRMPRTNWEVLKTYSIPKPDLKKVIDFNEIVIVKIQKIKSNQTQIRTLTALRDSLLPKLMSGEVKVVL